MLVVAAALLLDPGILLAQRTAGSAPLRAEARAAIERIIDSARVSGIPVDPLRDKVLEGVLKGADEQRIVSAVQSLSRELATARTVLRGSSNLTLLSAVASALHAGVSATELSRLVLASPDPEQSTTLPSALVVLVDIVARRVPTSVAANAIGDLLERGAQERQFAALRAEVEQDITAGRAPETALVDRARAQLRGLPERGVIDRRLPTRVPPNDGPMFEAATAPPT